MPATAVVETGSESVVFVQPDLKKPIYSMRRVAVTARKATEIDVLSQLLGNDGTRDQVLHPGEWVVTEGAILLKATLEDVQQREEANKTAGEKIEGRPPPSPDSRVRSPGAVRAAISGSISSKRDSPP